jgi:iron complex outermembrane receptor protein
MKHYFQLNSISLALIALLGGPVFAQSAPAVTEVGKITVTGEGDRLGAGLMIEEDSPKAKSTVTRAQLEKQRATSNPFQALNLNPGVNAYSYDATGLFGGGLRVRGFNADQMGFTIDGAPVNDSGNFAVYPQEYTDTENLCEVFVTQGATDNEAPHVGASGGNVGLVSCAPQDKQRVRLAQTVGMNKLSRTFVRFDTGLIGDFKAYISYSKSTADKWRGEGQADRDHVDVKGEGKVGPARLSASLLYNRAINNNFRTLTLDQANSLDYYTDFSTTVPRHLTPVNGTAQNEASIASSTAYYGYSLNPFENALASFKANVDLGSSTRLDVEPYYWYGHGTGGTQQTSLSEALSASSQGGGVGDLNGDGDTLDTIMIYRGSVTQTFRPGVTIKLTQVIDNHKLMGGIWYERARHIQTQPGTLVDNAGNIRDLWLDDSDQLIKLANGRTYQGRDWRTISTGRSLFLQDTIDLLNAKLQLTPAISRREIKRDFTNTANNGVPLTYTNQQTWAETLPSLGGRYQFTDQVSAFANYTRNMRVPSNFSMAGTASNLIWVNGVASGTVTTFNQFMKAETSNNIELGTRYRGSDVNASATLYHVKFKDRIASAYNPATSTRTDYNVGDSTTKGVEFELGTVPVQGFSAYSSLSYTKSTIDQDLRTAVSTYAATSGMQFPDTPQWLGALSLQYAQDAFMVNLAAKYTGMRYTTLTNDQSVPNYTLWDLNMAYRLPSGWGIKDPTLRVNVSNLLNKKYLLANSGSGSSFTTNATGTGASQPSLYLGSPRFVSASLQIDF